MPTGTLEVLLANANGLKSGDFFSKTDAYAVLSCGNQSQKSNVARNQGSNPTWNQRFLFSVDEGVQEITLKIMDEDFLTADDELGCVRVPLEPAFQFGKTATTGYEVVRRNGKNKGEVKLSLSFTPKGPSSFHYNAPSSSFHYNAPSNSHHGPSYLAQGSGAQGPYGSGSGGGWRQGTS